ncbi:antA/AntB antirepressor family protein [Rufibacter roseus]|uniref:AntA/AntB antirepressor family protein n=1 Tax=Rufibacter roseus TaxID=1567108 RepID=A0ABW2DLT5_9BACT|nr:antA/AntB antirepressor family protein [Rufibacter roseus]
MLEIHYSQKGTPFVWASNLHSELNIETPLRVWFPRMIDYGFELNQDYSEHNLEVVTSRGGKSIKRDWAVQLDMAKHIAMVQKSEMGKRVRQHLMDLDKKVQDGAYLTHAQISVLFDVVKALGFFSVQAYLEKEHFTVFNKPTEWWAYRAKLFNHNADQLKEMVKAIGIKYESQRQALFHLDRYELIRMAIVDLLIAMGKTETYAKNVALFAKQIAKEIKPEVYDDRGLVIDFKTPKQAETIKHIMKRRESPTPIDRL